MSRKYGTTLYASAHAHASTTSRRGLKSGEARREEHDREDEGAEARPVVAERRRDDVEEHAAETPQREERRERRRGARPPSDGNAERAHDHHADEVLPVERENPLVRPEGDERSRLDRGRDAESRREPEAAARNPATRDRVRDDDEAEECEGERAEPDREDRRDDRPAVPVHLEELERGEHRREPERVRVEAGEHRRGRKHRKHARRPERRATPLPRRDRREEDRRRDRGGEDEREIPDNDRREVVEEAVRRERVPARVREVVPDEDPVPDEPRPVQVNAGVARPRAEANDERRDDRRDQQPR